MPPAPTAPQVKLARPPRRLASLKDAAAYQSCSVNTVERQVDNGDLPAYRLPGSRLVRVDLNELDALLDAAVIAPTAADR
ncbi:hypothetical protein GCM10023094_32070 [Rhodococcus olei]|uniref:Helix-turn-helix domain-containing protein n=2 Tax=Rhodococcus olei TaxID=2161675 RepID=A0ABP8P8U1_9NOCA